jgi:hypothetical protein
MGGGGVLFIANSSGTSWLAAESGSVSCLTAPPWVLLVFTVPL